MSPTASVVVPFYKRTDLLMETVCSVTGQAYPNWQQILVNDADALTPELSSIRTQLGSEKSQMSVRNRLPKGASTCRNIGWKQSSGDYVLFLDSDDLLAPFCLEQRIAVMEANPALDFAVFPMLMFNSDIKQTESLWNIATDEDDIFRFLRTDAVWQTSGVIWRKGALEKINGFTEGLHCWQDVDIHLKALLQNLNYKKFYDLPPDCYYRKHSQGSISQERINTPEKLISRLDVFQSAMKMIKELAVDKTRHYENIRVMAIGILLSAMRSVHLRFFIRMIFSKDVWPLLTRSQLFDLLVDAIYYFGRINKLTPMSGRRARSERHLIPAEIGKHPWNRR